MTLAPGARLSSTIRSFSAVVHRRRRSGPDRTATLLTFAHLLANQSENYRSQDRCPEGGPHRRVTEHASCLVELGHWFRSNRWRQLLHAKSVFQKWSEQWIIEPAKGLPALN